MAVKMQYRTMKGETYGEKWGEWKDLPDALYFSSFYLPARFEFRAVEYVATVPTFVFTEEMSA